MQKRSIRPDKVDYQQIEFSNNLPVVLNPHSDAYQPRMPLHYHNVVEVSLCTKGRGVFFIEEKVYPYHEGTLVQLGPNVMHIANSGEGQNPQWITLYLDIQYLGLALSPESISLEPFLGNKVLHLVENSGLGNAVQGISEEYYRNDAYSRMALLGHLQLLLIDLSRCHETEHHIPSNNNPWMARIAPALNLIASSLDQSLPVSSLAEKSAMSLSNFRRTFKSAMGQSPHQYILKTRIQLAKSLLHDQSLSVLETSHRCGFESLSSFNRAFRKWTQLSPRQWREHLTS